ncbi:TPA: hypothetical protein N0F65_006420 [Lagenidium giganteum]|uniref:Uncharacterized protein n=1 Tax=Lagenidium giganteum TaxID=4803 RepID=A0AAV2Z288_9STRA|nr:TPA: hypothetical protein N0F65_006420 [Lagenidium giganteum]
MQRRPGRGNDFRQGATEHVVRSRTRSGSDAVDGDPGVAIMKAMATKAWQSNKVKSGLVMWAIGFFFMMLAPGLRAVTPEMKTQYETMMVEAGNLPEYEPTYVKYVEAQEYANEAKVWFWRFREPYASQVHARQQEANKWQAELDRLDAIREKKMKEAKQFVGIWSDYGMAEVRSRFWDAFEKGKLFAQQQTFYHMVVQVLTARNEDIVSTIFNWIFVAVMNFTTGLLGSLFYFFFSLISLVYSYQPDPVSALAFFVLAFVGAASVIAAYLFAMYGMVASGVYVVGKVLVRDALEQEERQRLRGEQW